MVSAVSCGVNVLVSITSCHTAFVGNGTKLHDDGKQAPAQYR